MSARVLSCVVALSLAPFAVAADEENPFKKVKVGDYATYKMSGKSAAKAAEGTMTQRITAKTDKEVTIKVTIKANGMEFPAPDQKIDLTKPFDPTKAILPSGTDAKLEKLKDGTEQVKAAGKTYETKWESYKLTAKVGGMDMTGEVKAWTSKDFALQLVKMEMSVEVAGNKGETTLELIESGSKAD